jgi:5-formyltetrahydrofolate cyclo-ligase
MSGHDAVLAEAKRELRRRKAADRDNLSLNQRGHLSSLVCNHAWNLLQDQDAASIMAYAAFRSELDTRDLIGKAWESQYEVFLPRVLPGNGTLTLHKVHSWNDLAPGTYGIPEPAVVSEEGLPEESAPMPDIVFVPGLAFDRRGGRLGYGRGYYDRLRSAWDSAVPEGKKRPLWIGVAYGIQVVEEVPMDIHDAYMDILITEEGIVHCRKENEGWN